MRAAAAWIAYTAPAGADVMLDARDARRLALVAGETVLVDDDYDPGGYWIGEVVSSLVVRIRYTRPSDTGRPVTVRRRAA